MKVPNSPASLPPRLADRITVLSDLPLAAKKPYVLYWMHHAIRDHENPALDVAVAVGNRISRPVLVYQGLGGRHPYNSDRHHTFILEGARDVQQGLNRRGIAYAFHLPERPDRPGPLTDLARNAALVVTETFPAPPFPKWVASLACRAPRPLWTVDTSCLIPMRRHTVRFERAFQFRQKTWPEYQRRVHWEWEDLEPDQPRYEGNLPFDVVDLETADIPSMCARSRIDHGVGPVAHTRGGTRAGYERWEAFKRQGLGAYARLRNDAKLLPPKGVSRLSPYLHYGMVSPFRIAREAASDGSAGVEKFLDELLVWRELAHNFCFHTPEPESIEALPEWARQTLAAHRGDPRRALLTSEELERAKTGDPLWDAMQRSLIRHGELHNNVRMTWGKAILQWSRSPAEALDRMIDLNHRFALDGCDPNSYGGILWCLGLFDRPFHPEQPVIGTLRPRPLEDHSRRIDLSAYGRKVDPPASGRPLSVAVVGAGLSGLRAAGILSDHGHRVTVFESAQKPGGRLGAFLWGGGFVDAGAQYFTVRDDRFRRHAAAWIEAGWVTPWRGGLAAMEAPGGFRPLDTPIDRWVALPAMERIADHLAHALEIRFGTPVLGMEKAAGAWRLTLVDEDAAGGFDAVVLALPADAAAGLLPSSSKLRPAVTGVRMRPCWAVMAAFENPLDLPWDGIFFNGRILSWAARNAGKPGRPAEEVWLLHGGHAWSTDHAAASPDAAASDMLGAFFHGTGLMPRPPRNVLTRFWPSAAAAAPLAVDCLWSETERIGVCGDWCAGSRIEGAFLSGTSMAGRLLGSAPALSADEKGAPGG